MTHRSGTVKALQDIEESIRHEQRPEELLVMLSRLLDVAETEVDGMRIDVGRMSQLAEYLAEIRYLLDRFGGDPALRDVSRMAKDMAARYRDLEGRVKEVRNDFAVGRT